MAPPSSVAPTNRSLRPVLAVIYQQVMHKIMFKNEKNCGKLTARTVLWNRGQAAIVAVLFLVSAMLVITGGFSSLALRERKMDRAGGNGVTSFLLAEASVEDILYRLKTGLAVSLEETLISGDTTVTTTLASSTTEILIRAEGDTKGYIRAVSATVSPPDGYDILDWKETE